MTSIRNRKRIRMASLLLVAGTLAGVSACTSDDPAEGKPSNAAPTPAGRQSSAAADPTDTAKREALTTYATYWREMSRSYSKGSSKETSLKDYAAGAALAGADAGMKNMRKAGQITVGQVKVGASTVTQIDMSGRIPNAKLSSCLDVSQWVVTDRNTRKPVALPSDRLTKYVVVSVVEKWPEGWRVIRDEPQEDSC
ncbi:hypothetical protein [Streptomyces sp. NPDC059651]|uniref:hypothetical protein n=1 Tax=Streptomyces sp. NPDC059651 TaxID=3346897 RepID=UPI0036C23813